MLSDFSQSTTSSDDSGNISNLSNRVSEEKQLIKPPYDSAVMQSRFEKFCTEQNFWPPYPDVESDSDLRENSDPEDLVEWIKISQQIYETSDEEAAEKEGFDIKIRIISDHPDPVDNSCSQPSKADEQKVEVKVESKGIPQLYECKFDKCKKQFKGRRGLRAHEKAHLDTNRPVFCEICGYRLSDKKNLKQHQSREHNKNKANQVEMSCSEVQTSIKKTLSCSYRCPLCNRLFSSTIKFRSHLEFHEDKSKETFTCMNCGSMFCEQITLHRHQKFCQTSAAGSLSGVLKEEGQADGGAETQKLL